MPILTEPQALLRLTDARYGDGLSALIDGADPVQIAQVVFSQDGDMPNPARLSTLFVSWGQFTDHDLSLTLDASGEFVPVPGLAGPLNRSLYDPATGITGPREQINQVTPEMDASQVYGSTAERTDALRSFEGGRLRTSDDPASPLGLMPLTDGQEMAGDDDPADPLFLAGDLRANENTGLTLLHTLFVREHNHWADRLADADPGLSDEELFQAARSIVEYVLQKITYDEWLPHLIGDVVDPSDAASGASGQIATEFSTAAFRFGHTLVSTAITGLAEDGTETANLSVRDQFFNVDPLKDGQFGDLLRGQAAVSAQALDTKVIDDLNLFLQLADGATGFSLPALNIVRGRDHGLESYLEVRAALVGDVDPAALDVTDFSVITADPALQADLAAVYGTVDRVDLWVGGLAEDKIPGTQMGMTFTAILDDQFTRTAAADESFGALDPLVPADIAADVSETTLADVLTRVGGIETIQHDPFTAMNRMTADPDDRRTTGSRDHDLIMGTETHDDLRGWDGGDNLYGGGANDRLRGQAGDDAVHGGAGRDLLCGGWGDDWLEGGTGDDILRGGWGDDHVLGGAGDDRMRGNRGDDLMDGGIGDDRMCGDAGRDTFVFALGYGRDLVMDFTAGEDVLDLSGTGLSNLADLEALAQQTRNWLIFDFGGGDELLLKRADMDAFTETDLIFG